MLNHPDNYAETKLSIDAIVGGLFQKQNGLWKPIAVYTHKLTDPQSLYSTFEHEFLAICRCIFISDSLWKADHFLSYLIINLLTQALTTKYLRSRIKSDYWHLSQFFTDIRHTRGSHNVVADALSRFQINKNKFKPAPTSLIPEVWYRKLLLEHKNNLIFKIF